MKLEGKAALVTGGGKGIGRAIALAFAGEGAKVAVADVDEAAAKAAAEEIASQGGESIALAVDVTDETQVRDAIGRAAAAFGGLQVLVNNAGIAQAEWAATIAVNLNGVYFGTLHGAAYMADHGGGSIINLASILGLVGLGLFPGATPYTASKHGVVGVTRSLALEYAKRGVRINCICPGFIDTDMTKPIGGLPELLQLVEQAHPMGRMGRPEEVARAAVFLASDDASYITGAPLIVDGGYTAQ